ncbi:gamma-glutamylcyclotransferase family protein [Devosia sp.]|uniref:gamma-glutamylcyclotransferase family protein n=1 Tax=Devosia sp. TaxID=1871048 RepID=UPI0037C02A26
MLLFVYGILRDPELLAAVLDRPLRADQVLAAVAPGYRATYAPNRLTPALVRAPGGAAEGLVLLGLSAFEHDLIDALADSASRRMVLPVMIGEELHEALAHLPAGPMVPGDPWSFTHWQAVHKAAALPGEIARAAEMRQRLIAIRPH